MAHYVSGLKCKHWRLTSILKSLIIYLKLVSVNYIKSASCQTVLMCNKTLPVLLHHHSHFVSSMPNYDRWLLTFRAALVIKIVQCNNSSPFASQPHNELLLSVMEDMQVGTCSQRAKPCCKSPNATELWIITLTLLSPAILVLIFPLISVLFWAQRFICHIRSDTRSKR